MRRHYRSAAPASEPLDTDAVKLHLRVEHAADDALIESLVVAAREQAEAYTGRALISQQWTLYDDAPSNPLTIPRWPVLSIVSVTDADVPTTAYTEYLGDDAMLIPNSAWSGAVQVIYTAGYAVVPVAIQQWMLLQIGQWYEQREAVAAGIQVTRMPFVDALLSPYRIHLLGLGLS